MLDVQLDEGIKIIPNRVGVELGIQANRGHRLANRHARFIAQIVHLSGGDQTQDPAGAPEIGVEAAVLLFAQGNHLQGLFGLARRVFQQP